MEYGLMQFKQRGFVGLLFGLLSFSVNTVSAQDKVPTGYDDTPYLPGQQWRVHDDERPRPKVVAPGKTATDAPADAIVLFNGGNLNEWVSANNGGSASWSVEDGVMTVPASKPGDIKTKREFGDIQLHVEWRTPEKVESNSQGRGNSGIIFMERYEVQVLDSYQNKTYADGQASSMYGFKPPLVNASRAPGSWQTYDIIFEAPRFNGDELESPAYVTVFHNGVVTQYRQAYLGVTAHKVVAKYQPHSSKGSLRLQDHSNPVSYRNIWVRELQL